MSSHPNRSKTNRSAGQDPTPSEIKAAREKAGLTQTEAAAVIYSTLSAWQKWEAGGKDSRGMRAGLFELFLLKTGQAKLLTGQHPLSEKQPADGGLDARDRNAVMPRDPLDVLPEDEFDNERAVGNGHYSTSPGS